MDEDGLMPGTDEYRKARRRRQNRESASRTRAHKREQLEIIQEKLQQINEVNNKMEMEIRKLRVENQELRQETVMNRKISFAYTKLAVLLSLFAVVAVQHFSFSESGSMNWLNSGVLGIIIIFIALKN